VKCTEQESKKTVRLREIENTFFPDCFFKISDLGFALADYQQALELDPDCWSTKCRVAVVHNEFGILAYQERLALGPVACPELAEQKL